MPVPPAHLPSNPSPADTLAVKVNGRAITVPKLTPDWSGKPAPTTMMQACETAGVTVPHYCYHHRLPVAGNCRMCLVEYGTPALGPDRKPILNPDGSTVIHRSPRPAIACATPVSPGMEIYTDTPTVKQMRQGVLEFLLINHPLDCPICDQAGECKLQEYSLEYGQTTSRFVETKVHKPKQVELGPRIMLDDERCILCTRCIRFTRELVGEDALGIINRGSYNTVTAYPGRPFDNNYTLNTVDLCPVGALTSKDFRFQMRVWFLKERPSLCPSCGMGCNILIGSRENRILRLTPRENEAVNRSWMCDYGRLNYPWIQRPDRLATVMIRGQPSTWTRALADLAEALRHAVAGQTALIASARLSNEELYLVLRLSRRLSAVSDCVPRMGAADPWLLQSDRNPNTTGACLLGISAQPMGSRLPQIADQIRAGTIRNLIVLGEDVVREGIDPDTLAKLSLLAVSDVLPNKTTAQAGILLPGSAPAEKTGSFINVHGRVQRFFKAVEPPGEARPESEFLQSLLGLLEPQPEVLSVEALFNRMARGVDSCRGLTWAGLGDGGISLQALP